MLDSTRTMEILETHRIQFPSGLDRKDVRGGWINGTQYVWFTYGANIDLYSTVNRCVESSRSFSDVQTNESLKINFVREVDNSEKIINLLLVGCSFKSSGILFVCQLPKLTTICCIALPNPVTFISTILNKSLSNDQLCNELKIMSTILLVGMATGEVYAIDLKEHYIKNQLETNKIVVNELKPSKLFIIKNNDNCQKAKQISNCDDFHLAMFLNEAYCTDYKKLYSGKLNFSISSLSYNEKINAIAIGYSTGHLELWDCKVTLSYTLKMPKYNMPITHITFLEPSYNPSNLCYLWVIQSNNSRLPNATMIALKYEQKTMMSNGCLSFKVFKENCIELEMSLWREAGIGQCISALTLCNDTLVRNSTDMNEHSEIKLFAMLMEIRQNVNASPESYIFLFDINQWYKAQMPSNINHLKVSNSFASFVKLPHNASYLDLNISNKTLRPFGYNFRNNVEELYSPSSIYFECDCLLDNEIIRFKHAGVQQEILDQLLLKNWRSLINPTLIFNQCLQTNLRPFFWDKTDDYINYNLLDKVHFLVALIVENEITSVFNACAEEFKNRTNIFCEPILLLLMHCLWNHFTLVKNYADQLCVSLFDYSGNLFCNENENMLYKCLSQMLHVVHFYESMHSADNIQILNVNLMNQEKIMKGVIQYFHSLIYFIHLKLLPKLIEGDSMSEILQFDFFSLVKYSNKRRAEFGDLPLYLIDAVINNEPYQLIEQWQLECDNESNGLYPPSSIKNLLMINLNTELPHIIKNFIITYFLIDACYLQEMNEIIKNILNDISKKNNRLYKLCGASWFLDHDMFENAMLIFTNYNEWLVDDDSWNWFHWNVLKLLVFKEQYYWAQNYLDLFEIKLINLDDHKFYVNLQIINQNCFDALSYMHSRDINEKNILFEYIFEQCRNTNQLQKILNYPLDEDEKILFFSCLQKFDDTKSIQFKFLFQEKRYSEALEVYKLISITRNFNITSVLIGAFTNIIPSTNRRELHKKIYPEEEIKNMFIMDNLFNIKNTDVIGHSEFFQNNLIIPDVIYNDEAIDKSRPILDENIDKSNLKELDITLESENKSEKPTTSVENENCLEKEEINSMSGDEDVEKLEQSSKNHNRINNDNCNLEKPNTSLEGKSNLKEVDIVILNEGIVENTFKPDVSSNCEYKDNLESPIVRPPDICEQSKVKLLQSLENTTTEYNDMLDYNNPEYLTDSQSNILENPTPCIGGLAKENHSIDNNQVCEEEYENTFGNIINGNKTLFLVKEDYYGTKLLENEDKNSSAPNYSLDIDNNQDDLCNDLNEFNLIPEYNLNYHNMIGDNEIQQKLISFNETLLENCNVKVQAKKNGTQDSAIDNHEEIVTDEISEKIESFSVSPNVESEKTSLHFEKIKTGELINSMKSNKDNVNLYDQEIESHQLVKSKDIAPNQIDTKISNFAKNKCAMKDKKLQNNYPSTSSKPSKSKITKEYLKYNDEKNEPPIPLASTKMTTRLRSKQIKVESIPSSTTSSTSEIIEDCFDNVSKKRSKCQNKNLKKRCVEKVQKNYSPVSSKPIKSIAIKKEFPCSNDERNKLPNPLTSTKMTTRLQSKQVKVKSISSNTSAPTSEIIEDCFDNVSKKRSKCQNKNLKKRCVEKVQKNYSPVSSKPIKSIAIKKEFPCSNDERNKLPNPLTSTKMTTRLQSKQVKVKSISSNTSAPTSEIIEDCFDNVSKKRSKCQNKNLKKRCVEKVQKNYSPVSSKPIKSIAIKKEFPCSNDEKNKLPNPLPSTKMTTRLQSKQLKVESISSNTSAPTSEIIEDCFDNVSKKRSKCQNKNLKKRCVEKVQKNYSPVSSKPIKSVAIKKEFPCSNDEKNKLPNPLASTKMTTRLQSKQLKVEQKYLHSNNKNNKLIVLLERFDIEAYKKSLKNQKSD